MRRSVIALVACSGLALSGCVSQGGGGYHTAQGAGLGALGGAATGAAVGALTGHDAARSALIGAGIGVLAGGAVGAYMDSQEAELRQDLAGTNVQVQRQGDTLLLTMPANVTFDVDSAQIKPQFRGTLSEVARTLANNPQSYVEVHGHTDSTGAAEYNQGLSEQRAQSVVQFMQSNGVMPQRLFWQGHGERRPVATNDTPEGRQMNRRVELRIVPHTA